MTHSMQAAGNRGAYDYRLEAVDVPAARSREVVAQTAARGICASDMKYGSGAAMFWGDADQPADLKGPVIPTTAATDTRPTVTS
ncbi:hypothetical protein V5738_17420 [Salinisphaera sp. SPP-AMP-43]|uniref:hypothetical protein n=1 Tax=Salinisphaera sp. SPP-AMP-43 TaxID=3121288 RepID=UPI003C6DEE6B